MAGLNTTQLAKELNLSKGRISQLVGSGQLDGTYTGDGRSRRFDLAKVSTQLNLKLDKGQMLGNGAKTKRALRDLDPVPKERSDRKSTEVLPTDDPGRYEMARTMLAEENARKARRQNAEAEGLFVLADDAARQAKRLLAQELAQIETMLRDAARHVADELGVDYLAARAIMIASWRDHRGQRSAALSEQAEHAVPTDGERNEDF